MMIERPAVWLGDLGVVCCLGAGKRALLEGVLAPDSSRLTREEVRGIPGIIGRVPGGLEKSEALLDEACSQIEPTVRAAIARYGADRVAVLLGSTDNGSEASLRAYARLVRDGDFPPGYQLEAQMADKPVHFVAARLGARGPSFAASTACASSASAIAAARRLIGAGVCDAAIAGGVDIVSDTVFLGFSALEAVAPDRCNPFSVHRCGITLGEAAALFLVTRDRIGDEGILLLGAGESSDAHHMTAPDPRGEGALRAMRAALKDAGTGPEAIAYVNLHGTGTVHNDSMEAIAVEAALGAATPASSTKPLTGHTLGAAGALELGICWTCLSTHNTSRRIPPHVWDGAFDPAFPALRFARAGDRLGPGPIMSNSFAFGGVNVSLILDHKEVPS